MPFSHSLPTRLHHFPKVKSSYSRPNSELRCGSSQPVCQNCARCWKEGWRELSSAQQKRHTNLLLQLDQQVLMPASKSSRGLCLEIQPAARSMKLCQVSTSELAQQTVLTLSWFSRSFLGLTDCLPNHV